MFNKNKHQRDGLTFYCRDCVSDYGRAYRGTTRGVYKALEGNQKFFHRHSSEQSKPFLITYEAFERWYETQEKKCGYCYLPEADIHNINDTHNEKVSRLTVDCMDNAKGYVLGNIILACNRCNFIKNDFLTYDQMLYYSQTYIKPVWEKRLGRKLT